MSARWITYEQFQTSLSEHGATEDEIRVAWKAIGEGVVERTAAPRGVCGEAFWDGAIGWCECEKKPDHKGDHWHIDIAGRVIERRTLRAVAS